MNDLIMLSFICQFTQAIKKRIVLQLANVLVSVIDVYLYFTAILFFDIWVFFIILSQLNV